MYSLRSNVVSIRTFGGSAQEHRQGASGLVVMLNAIGFFERRYARSPSRPLLARVLAWLFRSHEPRPGARKRCARRSPHYADEAVRCTADLQPRHRALPIRRCGRGRPFRAARWWTAKPTRCELIEFAGAGPLRLQQGKSARAGRVHAIRARPRQPVGAEGRTRTAGCP